MTKTASWIKFVSVQGLHGSIDIDVGFLPGINIIFGENGVGKTTLLHIISNIANFDFERFESLTFSRIILGASDGERIELVKIREQRLPQVLVNGRRLSVTDDAPHGSEMERALFINIFGRSPIYIPAFRNILQKIDSSQSSKWDTLKKLNSLDVINWGPQTLTKVDKKTAQCRSWFGEFVPTIRFPSVEEVESELENYWSRADSAARREEAKMISEATNKILADLLGSRPDDMKVLIETILESTPLDITEKDYMADDFSRAIAQAGRRDIHTEVDPNSLAALYINALIKAKAREKNLFRRANRFVESMNEFLLPERELKVSSKSKLIIEFKKGSRKGYGVNGLSSGERQLLTLLFSAWTQPGESNIMLVDEPEISLHIDWQRAILSEMHKQSGQQIIACTHAPEVAAELDDGYQIFERISRYNGNA